MSSSPSAKLKSIFHREVKGGGPSAELSDSQFVYGSPTGDKIHFNATLIGVESRIAVGRVTFRNPFSQSFVFFLGHRGFCGVYLERLFIQEVAEANRTKGVSLANSICRNYRREGLFYDEILEKAQNGG